MTRIPEEVRGRLTCRPLALSSLAIRQSGAAARGKVVQNRTGTVERQAADRPQG